jgi:transcriptional regulator with XRE-family HTH domain
VLNRVLKLTRQYHRLTQSELADRLGISKSYVCEIEANKKTPTLDLMERYAAEFRVPASTFLLFSEKLSGGHESAAATRANKLLKFLEWAGDEEDERASS